MFTNRILKIVIVLALIVVAGFTVRAFMNTEALMPAETEPAEEPAAESPEATEAASALPVGAASLDLVRIVELPLVPHDFAVGANGSLYVVDSAGSQVVVYDSSGTRVAAWGSAGSGEGQFAFLPPADAPPVTGGFVALDAAGNVYVTDAYNNRVQKFDSAGNFIAAWNTIGTEGAVLNVPGPISSDRNGNVYVADFDGVHVFDAEGNYQRTFAGAGEAALDSAGNIHVPIAFQNQMTRLNPNGEVLATWGGEGASTDGLFIFPKEVVVDRNDHLYVADHSGRLQIFDTAGNFLGRFNITSADSLQVEIPVILAAGPDETLYVGAEDRASVYVLRSFEESEATDIYPEGSIAAVLEADGRFTTALELFDGFKGADMGPWPWLQNPQRALTFFAPTDEAFTAVPAETMDLLRSDETLAGQLFCHHILDRPVDSEALGLLQNRTTCVSLDSVTILATDSGFTYDGANVVEMDIIAGNNVIHVIDAVTGLNLLP